MLRGRHLHGRALAVIGKDAVVEFELGNAAAVEARSEDGFSVLRLTVTDSIAKALAECLQPKAGVYRLPEFPRFEVVVERAEIKDTEGRVVEVIG